MWDANDKACQYGNLHIHQCLLILLLGESKLKKINEFYQILFTIYKNKKHDFEPLT